MKRRKYHEIKVRLKTEAQKARFERAAKAAGRSLSNWMTQAAEAAVGPQ